MNYPLFSPFPDSIKIYKHVIQEPHYTPYPLFMSLKPVNLRQWVITKGTNILFYNWIVSSFCRASPETHYMFVAVRHHQESRWCIRTHHVLARLQNSLQPHKYILIWLTLANHTTGLLRDSLIMADGERKTRLFDRGKVKRNFTSVVWPW